MALKVSIIIPFINCEDVIEETVSSVLSQLKNGVEVVVVGTKQIANTNHRVKFVKVKKSDQRNTSMCRNIGARASGGKILVFLDGDCQPERAWLKSILGGFRDPNVVCICGSVRSENKTIFDKYAERAYKPIFRPYKNRFVVNKNNFHRVQYPIGGNFAIKRSIFEEMHGFDESMECYEDIDLFWRLCSLNLSVTCMPNASVRHKSLKEFFPLVKKFFRYGIGCGKFCTRYQDTPLSRQRISMLLLVLSLLAFSAYSILKFPVLLLFPVLIFLANTLPHYIRMRDRYSPAYLLFDLIFCGLIYQFGILYGIFSSLSNKAV